MYTTNVWEEGYNWNGVIFPATKSQIKPFTNKDSAIKGHENYIGRETGDIGFDLYWLSKKSYDAQGIEVTDIGRFITYGPQTAITVNHKMVIGATTFTVNGVDNIADENGAHHTVIRFGR